MKPSRFSLAVGAALLLAMPLRCAAQTPSAPAAADQKMMPQTRLLVMRDFTAEHCFARHLFPMGTEGLEIKHGQVTPKDQQLDRLIAEHGLAAKPGDRVVISNVEVRDKSIVMEINGGPKRKEKWYKHIQVGVGGSTTGSRSDTASITARGSMVTLAFDKYVPELTADQLREMLAPVFDFKALTVAEAYEKTLPPKVQQAIKDHQVLVGMDREMVTYAKGRAPHKIRDKDESGQDYEEWIYGDPPQEVDFVRFNGELVTRLEIMTVDGQKIVRTEPEVHLDAAETEVAQQKAAEKPAEKRADAPSLLRPGEQPEVPASSGTHPSTPYPNPGANTPPPVPSQQPPI
jgi:hypothetical protein